MPQYMLQFCNADTYGDNLMNETEIRLIKRGISDWQIALLCLLYLYFDIYFDK